MQQEYVVHMLTDNIKHFLHMVQLVKWSNKQVVVLKVDPDGMTLTSTDDSKCLQGTLLFKSQFFSRFEYYSERPSALFGVPLPGLVDCLTVFATHDGAAELGLHWPDAEGRLCLELTHQSQEERRAIGTCMYAHLACEEVDRPPDYTQHFEDPCSSFILWAHILKEVMDDLEWPGGSVAVCLEREPPRIAFEAQGQDLGGLTVEVDVGQDRFSRLAQCALPQVIHRYKYKHLKIATNMSSSLLGATSKAAGGEGATTKVTIDAKGLMKIHHLMRVLPQNHDYTEDGNITATAYFTLNPEELLDEDHDMQSTIT